MATVTTSYKIDQAAIEKLLTARTGPVAGYIAGLGKDVVSRARGLAPRKSGKLIADIATEWVGSGRGAVLRIGNTTAVKYATYQLLGTGQRSGGYIFPRKAKVLRFESGGDVVFARKVKGIKPNPYLTIALNQTIGH